MQCRFNRRGLTVRIERSASEATRGKDLCLVLGGNGFIGSHVVDQLVAGGGMRVRVLDPFVRPPQFQSSRMVQEIPGDAYDARALAKALVGVDYVVHSLPATAPFVADTNPYADIENLRRSVEVFERCVAAGIRKIAFVSSSGAVYGLQTERKAAAESDLPLPVSPYGICKLATEHYLGYFRRKYGMAYVVYRLSNPYGPRQPFKVAHGVVPAFLRSYLIDEEITIQGDGSASRDYIYVEDAARMIAGSLRRDNRHSVYNIGSGQQTTLNDIVAALEQMLCGKLRATYLAAPRTTLQRTDITVRRFREEFGEPTITLFADGLRKTVESLAPARQPAPAG